MGGRIEGIAQPDHTGLGRLCPSPRELRAEFARLGWGRGGSPSTPATPCTGAHFELTYVLAAEVDAGLLLHPVVGMTKPGDLDAATRMRCYEAMMGRYPAGRALLAAIPMAMRMSGPRDALWNAIIRKNYGCTHYIVGRDHASPGDDMDGTPFYGPYDCQDLLRGVEAELGMTTVGFPAVVYVPGLDRYLPEGEVPAGRKTRKGVGDPGPVTAGRTQTPPRVDQLPRGLRRTGALSRHPTA